MKIEIGDKYLITTDKWFFAPDGAQYLAVFGTVNAITNDNDIVIKTNRHSANWFVTIGSLVIAGCQIHYAVKTDNCNLKDAKTYSEKDGEVSKYIVPSRIYDADGEY